MKTKELIRQLQKLDPEGECECCISNLDIRYVDRMPYYYDGTLEVLKRDENGYVVGAEYPHVDKIKIVCDSIGSIICDHPDAEFDVDYSGLSNGRDVRYKASHEEARKRGREIQRSVELWYFKNYMKKRAVEFSPDLDNLDYCTEEFFDTYLGYSYPMDPDLDKNDSWANRREKQWDRLVDLKFDGLEWHLSLKEQS